MDDQSIPQPTTPTPLTISLPTFVAQITKTPDFVYAKLLKTEHGRHKFTEQGWRDALDALRNKPV